VFSFGEKRVMILLGYYTRIPGSVATDSALERTKMPRKQNICTDRFRGTSHFFVPYFGLEPFSQYYKTQPGFLDTASPQSN
jgi:hypothetical protein